MKELTIFLELYGRTADPDCVTKIIYHLGETKDVSSVTVLIGLLDFRRPDTEMEKQHIRTMEGKYPAVEALFSIGKPAVPAIVSTLAGGKTSDISRENALLTLVEIYREDPSLVIPLLKKAAEGAKTSVEAARLQSSARDVIKYCGKVWHDTCVTASTKPR